MRPVNRITPAGPVHAYKTYQIDAPAETHYRTGTCAEAECEMQASGWVTVVDETTELGERQAFYIRHRAGRPYRESIGPDGMVSFTFPPGAECFRTHQIRLDRPEIFTVRGGDWRGTTGLIRRHRDADGWKEDLAEHQDMVARRVARG